MDFVQVDFHKVSFSSVADDTSVSLDSKDVVATSSGDSGGGSTCPNTKVLDNMTLKGKG